MTSEQQNPISAAVQRKCFSGTADVWIDSIELVSLMNSVDESPVSLFPFEHDF